MTVTDLPAVVAARDWRSEWQKRWRDASEATRTRIQVVVFLAVVLVAYHYSLSTLLQTLNLDTPLAYIGLVPIIALGLAAIRAKAPTAEPDIHDRQVDYIIGVPLILTALSVEIFLPHKLSAMFWVWRIDLLSLPFFVAGVGAVMFGVRAMWRQRLAVAYLFLAWPVPFSYLLVKILGSFTNMTLTVLHPIARLLHVGAAPGADQSVFLVSHNGRVFPLSVVSACSGVNGMVGFLLVGAAFAAIVTGPRLRKTLWIIGGLFLLWGINLLRLALIFWSGSHFGEHFAIEVLHPFIGLVTFNVGVLFMVVLLKPAGLRIGPVVRAGQGGPPVAEKSVARSLAVPNVFSAVAIVVVVGIVLGINNGGLRSYDLVANAAGEPKLASFLTFPSSPALWPRASFDYEFDFAKPFFGESSHWYRWSYTANALSGSDLYTNAPVVADVVNTNNLESFSAYGVEACYRFHGYSLKNVAQVNLGGGITGQTLSYSSASQHLDWSIVYWIWPVVQGNTTHYERVILYLQNTATATVRGVGPVTGIKNLEGGLSSQDTSDQRLLSNRNFLVAFAREVIKAQATVKPGTILPKVAFRQATRPAQS
jgi:exosortase/archaeosortase family protein